MTPDAAPDPQRAWVYRPEQPLTLNPSDLNAAGPLSGLTFSVKDLYGVPGWPLTGSTRAPLPEVAESVLVRRLLELGASAVGKTHLHEVALGITGHNGSGGTEHPFLAGHVPGGSSSGAAVSAALGQVDFALGTDTGGSIRVPAAWCGVSGYKPTKNHPAWSTQGVLPLSWTCDHAGPLARDLGVIVRVHGALSGEPVTPQAWAGLRVGLWLPDGWTDDTVAGAVHAFAARLEGLGATVERVAFPEVLDAYSPIVLSEAAQVHAAALALDEPGFLPFTEASLRSGAALSAAEVQRAFDRRAEYAALLGGLLLGYDVLLAPAVPTPPPLIGQDEVTVGEGTLPLRRAVLRLTTPFSLLGVPTLAVPTATPFVGVQLVAAHGQDERLLGLGLSLLAQALPGEA